MKFKSELISEIIHSKNIENGIELIGANVTKFGEDIILDKFDIVTDEEAKFYGKQKGKYRLLSINNPIELFGDELKRIEKALTHTLKEIIGKLKIKDKVLIVGLGNRNIMADSLGTFVCKKINITLDAINFPKVMALCPSVLGLTGIETYEIVKGVVDRVRPTHLILIDSLCAKDESRLCRSIQATTTGVCPGSGIGNNRKCLDSNLAPHVYSIGVPMLIYASTFVENTFEKNNVDLSRIINAIQKAKKIENSEEICALLKDIKTCINGHNDDVVVSLKDIEECAKILSNIIANSINSALGLTELK